MANSVKPRGQFVSRRTNSQQRTPHSGSKLGETTDEHGHADDGIGDGDATGRDVVHGEDEGCGGEGEEAAVDVTRSANLILGEEARYSQRTRVTKDPQLGGGVVDVGVGKSAISSALVVSGVGVGEGGLVVGIHVSHRR